MAHILFKSDEKKEQINNVLLLEDAKHIAKRYPLTFNHDRPPVLADVKPLNNIAWKLLMADFKSIYTIRFYQCSSGKKSHHFQIEVILV